MGTRTGHLTLQYLRTIFQPNTYLGDEPVQDVFEDIVFGTGKDDNALISPCKDDGSLVEVYGYYGNDGKSVLTSTIITALTRSLLTLYPLSFINNTQSWFTLREIVVKLISLVVTEQIPLSFQVLQEELVFKISNPSVLTYSVLHRTHVIRLR